MEQKTWKQCQTKLLNEIINTHCMLIDEVDNFDDYLSEMMDLYKHKIFAQYTERGSTRRFKKVYEFTVVDVFATSPYVPDYGGVDTPESAILRANYEANIFGKVRLTIYEKPNDDFVDETEQKEQVKEEEDEEDNDAEDDGVVSESDPEDVEFVTDDEEEDVASESDHEVENDEDHDLSDEDLLDVKSNAKRLRDDRERNCFGHMCTSNLEERIEIFQRESTHLIGKIPIFVRSQLCWLRQPFGYEVISLFRPEFTGGAYIVSRHLQISDMDEYYINNRPLLIAQDEVQVRSQFFNPDKIYRTNNTLKVKLHIKRKSLKKLKKKRHAVSDLKWLNNYKFLVEIPYTKSGPKNIHVSIFVMAMGWNMDQFITALQTRFTSHELKFLEEELNFFFDVLRDGRLRQRGNAQVVCIRTQKDAMMEIGLSYEKFGHLTTVEEKLSFVSRQIRQEYLPSLIDPSKEMTAEDSMSIDYVYENSQKCWMIVDVVIMLIRQSQIVRKKQELHDMKQIPMFDKNSYVYKRHHSAGYKLTALLRKMMTNTCSSLYNKLKSQVTKGRLKIHELVDIVFNMSVTKHVIRGDWNTQKRAAKEDEKGKTQMMSTGNNSAEMLNQVQRMKKYGNPRNPQTDAFGTHPTYDGRWGPYFTPESRKKVGVTWYKSLGARISPLLDYAATNDLIYHFVREYAQTHCVIMFSRCSLIDFIQRLNNQMTVVRDVYGKIIAWVDNPQDLYRYFVSIRRRNGLHFMLGLEYLESNNTFYFHLDEGRSLRPLIVAESVQELMHWSTTLEFEFQDNKIQYCVQRGWMEYMDANEEQSPYVYVASSWKELNLEGKQKHTHMIVHGVLTMTIPLAKCFVNHNQGAKRQQAALREKSSIGMKILPAYGTTSSLSLNLGQMPLVSNPVERAVGLSELEPTGVNVMVAMLAMEHNIEDSMIIKQKCVQFGVSNVATTKVFSHSLKDESYKFTNPPLTAHSRTKQEHYRHLGTNGLPAMGALLEGGDVVIGQIHLTNISQDNTQCTCVSIALPNDQQGTYRVIKIETFPNDEKDPRVVKVYLVQHNEIEVGDKINMGHGQKGTISRIMRDEDMPFICTGPMAGVSPDVIMNPHCMKRNTMGLMLEMLWSKARAIAPAQVDIYDTIFKQVNEQVQDVKSIHLDDVDFLQQYDICRQVLQDVGLMSGGQEVMRMGTTGQLIQTHIYTGDAYMRTLPQVVRDKIRHRSRGPINELTRATTSGKKFNGGLKIDEQLLWSLHAYGVKHLENSLMYDNTNKFAVFYCIQCNVQATCCTDISFYMCPSCQSSEHIRRIPMPYIGHLIMEELYSVGFGIRPIFDTEESSAVVTEFDETRLIEDFQRLMSQQN